MDKNIILKAKEVKTVDELLALAKENGIDLTEEEANTYFAQLNPKIGELSDDELDAVAGGGCETKVDGEEYTVVSPACKCFTGQYLCNYEQHESYYLLTISTDHVDLRGIWMGHCGFSKENKCGSCAHLGFKDGIGYCRKS